MSVICNHRWWASRVEVPDSVPVLHVCEEPAGLDEHAPGDGLVRRLHRCSCGATLGGDGGGGLRLGPEGAEADRAMQRALGAEDEAWRSATPPAASRPWPGPGWGR